MRKDSSVRREERGDGGRTQRVKRVARVELSVSVAETQDLLSSFSYLFIGFGYMKIAMTGRKERHT